MVPDHTNSFLVSPPNLTRNTYNSPYELFAGKYVENGVLFAGIYSNVRILS